MIVHHEFGSAMWHQVALSLSSGATCNRRRLRDAEGSEIVGDSGPNLKLGGLTVKGSGPDVFIQELEASDQSLDLSLSSDRRPTSSKRLVQVGR